MLSSFKEDEADVGFMIELAPQEEIEKSDSSVMIFSIAVQLNKSFMKEDYVILVMPDT